MENVAQHPGFRYRPDIDGLRAIAVVAVILYHYGIGNLHGGFIGVDIFFVISGYLITGIIHKEIGRREFTFAYFYERRVRRIFPALFVVLVATLVAGAWLLLPSDLLGLGRSTLATLLFGANILYWRQSGYFDTSSEYNPLLHTWSLAVEEQFYIGLPILLILVYWFLKGRWLKPALLACMVVSFGLCIWLQGRMPAATFFLSPFRAWELLLGSLLAVGALPPIERSVVRATVSWLALTALLWSLWSIQAGGNFPGWQAAIPVLATGALLHAGATGASQVQRLLSLRPMVFVGLISYSLYLWHWPLLVFARYRNTMQPLDAGLLWLLLMLSVLLAAASYRWVETPLRRRRKDAIPGARRRPFTTAAAASVVMGVVAAMVIVGGGWRTRFSPNVQALDDARNPSIPYVECSGVAPPHDMGACVVGYATARRRIMLWGDSYALAWVPAFDRLGKRHGFAVELAWLGECPGLLHVAVSASYPCKAFNDKVAARIASKSGERLDAVVLVGSWGPYLDPSSGIALSSDGKADKHDVFEAGLARTAKLVTESGLRLVIVGPTPGAPSDIPYRLAASEAFGLPRPDGKSVADSRAYNARFWDIAKAYRSNDRVALVDPLLWFEVAGRYRYTDESGRLLYRDGGHLSVDGAAFVASHFPVNALGPSDMAMAQGEAGQRRVHVVQ